MYMIVTKQGVTYHDNLKQVLEVGLILNSFLVSYSILYWKESTREWLVENIP